MSCILFAAQSFIKVLGIRSTWDSNHKQLDVKETDEFDKTDFEFNFMTL